ncbi:MAG: type II secretion system F family protein [Candidatus Hadarchaeota archaeon]
MPKKKKKFNLLGAFSRIGGGVVKTGEAAKKIGTSVKAKGPEKGDEVSRRLAEIKRLETLREEELKEERKLREEEAWEGRAELKVPLSERLSEIFYGLLKSPSQKLVGSLKGIGTDLYRANLNISLEKYAALVLGISVIVAIFAVVFMILLRMPLILIPIGGFLGFGGTFFFAKSYPKRRAKSRTTAVNRLIPYAMRHMATQLSSGIGLPETMTSVSRAGYGALSEEFGRAIQDMNTGMSLEEALTAMDERLNSEPLRRALRQIQRTLRTGGDLSRTLNVLADETALEMRMKLRDYVQSLNMFTMIYMFISAVIPAMFMVVIMIAGRSGSGGGGISPQAAGVLYLIMLPFLMVYFLMMMKRFEPRL